MVRLEKLILIFSAWLTACNTPPTLAIPPTPQPVTVSLLPSLRPVSEAVLACGDSTPGIVIFIREVPAAGMDFHAPGLKLWLGDKPLESGFAAPLVEEEIAVIVNPENPLESIRVADLRKIFSGQLGNWEEIAGIDSQTAVWVYPEGNEIQKAFTENLLESQAISSLAYLAPGTEAMLEAVAMDPAAIGFIPKAWRTEAVKILSLSDTEGSEPGDASNLLPVLVLANREPKGPERAFVACLQSRPSLDLLLELYSPWK
jgi:hypothetical protein